MKKKFNWKNNEEYQSNNNKFNETIYIITLISFYVAIFILIRFLTNNIIPEIPSMGHFDIAYGILALFACFCKKVYGTFWLLIASSICLFILKPSKYAGGGIAEWFIYSFLPIMTLFFLFYIWSFKGRFNFKNKNKLKNNLVIIVYASFILFIFTLARFIFGTITSYVFYLQYLNAKTWKAAMIFQFTYLPIDTLALYLTFFILLFPMWKIYLKIK